MAGPRSCDAGGQDVEVKEGLEALARQPEQLKGRLRTQVVSYSRTRLTLRPLPATFLHFSALRGAQIFTRNPIPPPPALLDQLWAGRPVASPFTVFFCPFFPFSFPTVPSGIEPFHNIRLLHSCPPAPGRERRANELRPSSLPLPTVGRDSTRSAAAPRPASSPHSIRLAPPSSSAPLSSQTRDPLTRSCCL